MYKDFCLRWIENIKICAFFPNHCFSGSEAVKSGLLLQRYWNCKYSDRRAKRDALGVKTFRGLLHDIRMSFVRERVHTGCHIITSVKFIRNESFLSEFIGVFITERNTHSGRPFLPVQCKRGTALIFVWILCRSEGSIEKDRKGHKHLFLQANCCHSHTDKT